MLSTSLRSLADASLAIASLTENVYDVVCETAVRNLNVSMAWVGIIDNDELLPVAGGFEEEDFGAILKSIEFIWLDASMDGPSTAAVKTGKLHVIDDISQCAAFQSWKESVLKAGYMAAISFPLISSQAKTIGVLSIYNRELSYKDEDLVNLLQVFASQVAPTVEIRLYLEEQIMIEKKMEEELDYSQRMNKLMVGRELRMGELKKENEKLKERIAELEEKLKGETGKVRIA